MENQNQNIQTNDQIQGWQDVQIVPDMPLTAIVQFLNILNQRLCAVEGNVFLEDNEGKKLSLTEIYALQAQAEIEAALAEEEEEELLERAE